MRSTFGKSPAEMIHLRTTKKKWIHRGGFSALVATVGILLLAAPVAAEKVLSDAPLYPGDGAPPAKTKKEWKVRLGGFGLYHPRYEGSNDYEIAAFPFFDVSWRNLFFNPRKGLGFYVPEEGPVKIGMALGYAFGRDEDDAEDLDGLGDVDGGLTANGLLEWKIIKGLSLEVRAERQITGENTGTQCHVGLGTKTFLPPKFILRPSIRATWASRGYMRAYFGVDADQSAGSGYPETHPGAGIKSIGLQVLAIYPFAQKWGIQALAGYERLVGDAAGSPVVRDADQFNAGLGLSRNF